MDTIQSKTCTKCGADKPLTGFWKHKDRRDGHYSVCKACKYAGVELRATRAAAERGATPPGTEKECPICGKHKPIEDFPQGVGKFGRHTWCTPCGNIRRRELAQATPESIIRTKASKRKCATGFTHADFTTAHALQNHCCAICHADFSTMDPRHTHADHDHLTGEKRGLLCGQCNRALGLMNDSSILLRRAAEYLENPPLRGKL